MNPCMICLFLVLTIVCNGEPGSAVKELTLTKPSAVTGNPKPGPTDICHPGYAIRCETFDSSDPASGGTVTIATVYRFDRDCVHFDPDPKQIMAYLIMDGCDKIESQDIRIDGDTIEAKKPNGKWDRCENKNCQKDVETNQLPVKIWKIMKDPE